MKITYLHVGCQEKENKKTKTAFYLACKNPAKMDTTKKEQKKDNWSWKKEKKQQKPKLKIAAPSLSQERMLQGVERMGSRRAAQSFQMALLTLTETLFPRISLDLRGPLASFLPLLSFSARFLMRRVCHEHDFLLYQKTQQSNGKS